MKFKLLMALGACALSAAATAQMPPPRGPGPGPHMDRPHMQPQHRPYRQHRRHKVWVPAHREHGRRVPGHYVWR
jgi:Spy/CpxP family protein refolding chaperone